jgi:DNA-binding transcriptional MerR regulator
MPQLKIKGSGMRWFEEARVPSETRYLERSWTELTISEMADAYGVTMRTLRFYEEKGFLHPRRIGNRRIYKENDQRRMAVIVKGKRMGLSLEEIRELVSVVESDFTKEERISKVIDLCERHMNELDERKKEIELQSEETLDALSELKNVDHFEKSQNRTHG